MHLYSFGITCPFELLPYSLYIWNHYGDVPIVVIVVSSVWWIVPLDLGSWLLLFLHSSLCCSWLSAHGGKWHASRALLMWFTSLCSDS